MVSIQADHQDLKTYKDGMNQRLDHLDASVNQRLQVLQHRLLGYGGNAGKRRREHDGQCNLSNAIVGAIF